MASALTIGTSKPRATALSGGLPPPPPQIKDNEPQQSLLPAKMPSPSHAMTVATLRHFQAIITALKTLLADPEIGRTDMHMQIIDGMTKLVADRMIPAAEAVQTLSSVPERPFQQKAWAVTQLQQAIAARNYVLAHHAAAFAGQPPQNAPDPENHMQDIAMMMSGHYGQGNA